MTGPLNKKLRPGQMKPTSGNISGPAMLHDVERKYFKI